MPIYEYQCEACDNQFEELLLGSDSDPETCPKCDAGSVRRVISNTSFQLKGGGWYVTDYKASEPRTAAPAGSEESSDGGGEADSADAATVSSSQSATDTTPAQSDSSTDGSTDGSSSGSGAQETSTSGSSDAKGNSDDSSAA